MTADNTLIIQGGVTLFKKDSNAAIDGAGTISVGGGITAIVTGGTPTEGFITAGTDTTGGVLDLTGTGFITSPFVFSIGTAAPSTLEFDLGGGVVTPGAITINNVNQTLEVGPSGTVALGAAQNVTNGTILMAGGTLTDISGISFGTNSSRGSLSGFGTVTGALTSSGTATANTVADDGNLVLSTAIGFNSGLLLHHRQYRYIRSGTRQHAWSRKQLYVRGISRRTGAYRQRSERVRRRNHQSQCRKHPRAHELCRLAW